MMVFVELHKALMLVCFELVVPILEVAYSIALARQNCVLWQVHLVGQTSEHLQEKL